MLQFPNKKIVLKPLYFKLNKTTQKSSNTQALMLNYNNEHIHT